MAIMKMLAQHKSCCFSHSCPLLKLTGEKDDELLPCWGGGVGQTL